MIAALLLDYFGAALTTRCVKSLIQAGVKLIIIVDNSASAHYQRDPAAEEYAADLQIITIKATHNCGFAAGVELGLDELIRHSNWSHILILNNDCICDTTCIQTLTENTATNPIVMAPNVTSHGQQSNQFTYEPFSALLLSGHRKFGIRYYNGSALAFNRGWLKNNRPIYDQIFFMYGEDIALAHRLSLEKINILYVENAGIEHISNASSINGSYFYEYHINFGHLLLTRILLPQPQRLIGYALRVPILLSRALWRSIKHRRLIPLYAFFASALHFISGRKPHDFQPNGHR